jgi:hypothetical protein
LASRPVACQQVPLELRAVAACGELGELGDATASFLRLPRRLVTLGALLVIGEATGFAVVTVLERVVVACFCEYRYLLRLRHGHGPSLLASRLYERGEPYARHARRAAIHSIESAVRT